MSKRLSGWNIIQLPQRLTFLLLAATILLAGCVPKAPKPDIEIVYIDRFDIENKEEGLREPSGLTLSHEKDALWTVSDNAKKIFRLSLQGALQPAHSFTVADKGLEGITLDPTGAFLLTVQEENNELILLDVATQKVVEKRRLHDMGGYELVAAFFDAGDKNKGLEGVAWNSSSNTIFVLKEGEPGMLLELSVDLRTILNHKLLSRQNGFQDNNTADKKLDFSGLFYDATRQNFWIVSDQGQRLFLYDWRANRVVASMALAYEQNGRTQEIEKAEGVALDSVAQRLYIVSDAEARLYVFEVR